MTRHSQLASPAATRAYLERWGLVAKKSLGQHFLVDDGIVGRILRLADVQPDDCIVEVGPGIGTLTMALLAQKARVFAIEKDQDLLNPLEVTLKDERRFTLIAADALDFNALSFVPLVPRFKLVANLPYSVAATIVLAYFEHFPELFSATVMVQREVGERMMAEPGTKNYGAYTVKLRMFAEVSGSFTVARTNFMPQPRVDSMVIRLDRLDRLDRLQPTASDALNTISKSIDSESYKAVSFIVDAAFAQRRKTIRNSMRAFFHEHNQDPELVDALLKEAGINPNCRGETLSVAQFLDLGYLWKSGKMETGYSSVTK